MSHLFLLKNVRSPGKILVGLVLLSVSVGLFFSLTNASATGEDDKRLVTIHDKTAKKVVLTRATTVQEVLKQADIRLRPDDGVDPKLSTELRASSYQINIYRAQPILVIDGNTRHFVMSASETPRQVAASAGLPFYDEDTADLTRSDNVLDSDGTGLQLTIQRATKFNLVLYGKVIEARTQEKTVRAMLKDKNVKLAPSDTVSVPLETPVTVDMKVEVWRNGKQTLNEEQPVAFPVQQIQDADQPIGYKVIQTPGVLGKKNVSFEVDMQNGREISRRIIQEVVTLQPKLQVEVIGTKGTFSGSFGEALARLRSCEGSYTSNTGNGYYGAYQFNASAWRSYAPAEYANVLPYQAPPAAQDQAVWNYYQKSGWRPWPACSTKLGLQDIYR